MTEGPTQSPGVRAADSDREATVGKLEDALREGRITVDEFRQRTEAAYAATTATELEPLLADLPVSATPEVEIVGTRPPETVFNVMGDVTLTLTGAVPARVSTGFGTIRIDLRDLRTDAERIELNLSTVLGDVEVIVPEGVDAQLEGWTVLGNRTVDLAPVPRLAGTPRIVVRAHAILGDLRPPSP
jgi:hypothetical protein